MIALNVANGPKSKTLADVKVRQGLDLAIDREKLVKTVFNNEYIAGNQFISPENPYYDKKVPVAKRDLAKAKQLLKEGGQPNLAFTLVVPPERDRQEAALILQAMWAEAGITVNLQTQENVTMLQSGRKGDFEAYFTFWSGRPDPDGNVFTFSTCKAAQNDSHYCNTDLDALLTRARQVAAPAKPKKPSDRPPARGTTGTGRCRCSTASGPAACWWATSASRCAAASRCGSCWPRSCRSPWSWRSARC